MGAALPPGAPAQRATTASVLTTPSHGSGTPPERPSALSTHCVWPTQAAEAHACAPAQSQLALCAKPPAAEQLPLGVPYAAKSIDAMAPAPGAQDSTSTAAPRAVDAPQKGEEEVAARAAGARSIPERARRNDFICAALRSLRPKKDAAVTLQCGEGGGGQ